MQLLDVECKTPFTILLDNRMDVLSDTTTLNGYEALRREQLEEACRKDDRQIMRLGWKRVAALYKGSTSKEDYREMTQTLIS